MYDLIPTLASTTIQWVLFMLVPVVWWLVTARQENFVRWLGWVCPRTDNPRRLIRVTAVTFVLSALTSLTLIPAVAGRTANSLYSGMGWQAAGTMAVAALVQTALLEECVFRGFLLKRVASRFGFLAGNTTQALVFGAIHMVPFMLIGTTPPAALAIGLFTGGIAAAMGFINERLAGGSLVPSFALHAMANAFDAVLVLAGIT